LARHHDELNQAGAEVVGVSVDSPGRNAAMIEKLRLPFPLLSDPGGEAAIKPYQLWNPEREVAKPAVVMVGPDGEEAFRQVSRDFADRLPEPDLVDVVRGLRLDPVEQPPPTPGDPDPGPRAMPLDALPVYYRGAKFAAKAMGMRHRQAQEDADRYVDQTERYTRAVKQLTEKA
jgi:hypothetical protein